LAKCRKIADGYDELQAQAAKRNCPVRRNPTAEGVKAEGSRWPTNPFAVDAVMSRKSSQ
jgi:hypothetical protein